MTLAIHAEAHPLPTERAVYLGLVLNELVTNALKYAFPEGRPGRIAVSLRCEGETFVLRVEDDGIGLDENGDKDETDTRDERPRGGLGTRLLHGLAGQLRGSFARSESEPSGTAGELRFPVRTGTG
ncbi:sensor histidine kinase (plasmid) [Roseomonas sp. CCTCC AB2023176]|uniref:sensor histidine kinase n=1 Tax=Roseomonas sp. CCTCC AB2023176 TaxID=3342640 RepID=UPI0035E0C1FC